MGVGIVGCGVIAESYLDHARLFPDIAMRAVADLDESRARARADQHGLRAETVEGLLGSDDIDVVVNLTVPAAHAAVTTAILEAGKHAYSEKPLALSAPDAARLADLARARGLALACAPDTWLGAAQQEARRLLDDGAVGRIVHGTCHVMSPGMEDWHPNPDFFFAKGGGPVLDLGPYYVSALVNLLGPVADVAAMTARAHDRRTIRSEPRAGETVPVEVATTAHALLRFASGAIVALGASWDVQAHGHGNMELYGTEGTLVPQDPNFFGGVTTVHRSRAAVTHHDGRAHPLAAENRTNRDGTARADSRGIGLAEMIDAVEAGRTPRCDAAMAVHVMEVLDGIERSGETGGTVAMATACDRPAAFGADEARGLMRG